MDDEYVFHGDAGEAVTFTTSTNAAAFDPLLTLYDPEGRVAVRDDDRADGRNARLYCVLTRSGRWKLSIRAETTVPGGYQIQAHLFRPGPGYEKWAANLPAENRAPEADSDGDGVPNLMTYALTPHDGAFTGIALHLTATRGAAVVRVPVPALMRQGVTLTLESSPDPVAVAWAVQAVRRPFETWISPANTALTLFPSGPGRQMLQMAMPSGSARRFFRLRASLTP
jgi:hypothetical protein